MAGMTQTEILLRKKTDEIVAKLIPHREVLDQINDDMAAKATTDAEVLVHACFQLGLITLSLKWGAAVNDGTIN